LFPLEALAASAASVSVTAAVGAVATAAAARCVIPLGGVTLRVPLCAKEATSWPPAAEAVSDGA
jgi:hypothetical protein